jgi:peptidoglycan/xylan/chitin deacetylase (PgdA/CDA1 family)
VASVRILLTFDDGPHAAVLGGENRTEKVLDALRYNRAKAAFFIQTHVPYRLGSPIGAEIAARIHSDGHVLAIHTGSFVDHRCHKWRCTQPPDVSGASNGLDSDMIRAKAAIRQITGTDPKFVRATYGYTDANCMSVYATNDLKHVYWDVISGDDFRDPTCATVRSHLQTETKRRATGAGDLIYLLHDIKQVTAEHLTQFIDTITESVRENGHMPIFVRDNLEAESIMTWKSRAGTDLPCPADSMG